MPRRTRCGPTARTSRSSREYLRRELGRPPKPADVDHLLVRGFLAELHQRGLRKSSSARTLAALRSFFRYLCREGRLAANPARAIQTPRQDKRIPAVLDEAQAASLLDVPGDGTAAVRGRAILELLYGTGIRCAEAVALDVHEVDMSARMVRVLGKGRKERDRPLRPARRSRTRRVARRARAAQAQDRRAVPERARRQAQRPQRAHARRDAREAGGARPTLQPAHAAPQLRHAPADARGGPARDPGAARPREPQHHPALHARRHAAHPRGLQEGASEGLEPEEP